MSNCCSSLEADLAELAALDLLIADLNTTLRAIAAGGAQSYRLSTGQTDQSVMKLNIGTLYKTLQSAKNDRRMLAARLYGCGTTHIVPNS